MVFILYTCILQVMDGDFGSNGEVDFSLEPAAQGLFIVNATGPSSVQLIINHELDRESTPSYSFRVFATDRGSPALAGEAQIDITITVSAKKLYLVNDDDMSYPPPGILKASL